MALVGEVFRGESSPPQVSLQTPLGFAKSRTPVFRPVHVHVHVHVPLPMPQNQVSPLLSCSAALVIAPAGIRAGRGGPPVRGFSRVVSPATGGPISRSGSTSSPRAVARRVVQRAHRSSRWLTAISEVAFADHAPHQRGRARVKGRAVDTNGTRRRLASPHDVPEKHCPMHKDSTAVIGRKFTMLECASRHPRAWRRSEY
jgi:hypothetical protein